MRDFAAYLAAKHEEKQLDDALHYVAESGSFDFLKLDEDLYSVNELKERFDSKG